MYGRVKTQLDVCNMQPQLLSRSENSRPKPLLCVDSVFLLPTSACRLDFLPLAFFLDVCCVGVACRISSFVVKGTETSVLRAICCSTERILGCRRAAGLYSIAFVSQSEHRTEVILAVPFARDWACVDLGCRSCSHVQPGNKSTLQLGHLFDVEVSVRAARLSSMVSTAALAL